MARTQHDAWIWISPGVFQDKPVEYHARSVSNVFTQEVLRDDLSSAVRQVRSVLARLSHTVDGGRHSRAGAA